MNDTWTAGTIAAVVISTILFCIALIASILLGLFPALPKYTSLSHPTTTQSPMNREVFDLVLLFTSAFVGATIAFLAALITFAFHHEIRERLVQQGLIVPPNEPRPANPRAPASTGAPTTITGGKRRPSPCIEQEQRAQGLPTVRLLHAENDPNRHLRAGNFPAAFAAWGNRNRDPWEAPPDRRPRRLPTQGNIWDPHPQYILDWDQPLAIEQQPVDVPPTY